MKFRKSFLVAAALAAASLSSQATLVGSVSGTVLTLSDNFNAGAGQCSYISLTNGSCVSGTSQAPDGYLQMGSGLLASTATAGFSFSTYPFTTGAADVTLSFWYSTGLNKDAAFNFNGTDFTLASTGYNSINPGAQTASLEDGFFTHTFSNLDSAGYSVLWSAGVGQMRTLRVDDLSITITPVSAVPEPETYALMLSGLGLLGTVARRRNLKQG